MDLIPVTSIAHFSRYVEFPFVADVHLLHGDNPALYQVTESASQRNAATTTVKLLAIDGLACVVGCNNTAYRRLWAVLISLT